MESRTLGRGGNVRLLLLLCRPQSSVNALHRYTLLSSVAPLFTSFSSFSSPLTSRYQLISGLSLHGICFYGCPVPFGSVSSPLNPFSIFDICISLSFITFFLILSPHPTPFLSFYYLTIFLKILLWVTVFFMFLSPLLTSRCLCVVMEGVGARSLY